MSEEQFNTTEFFDLSANQVPVLSSTEDIFEAFRKTYFEKQEALNAKTQEIIQSLQSAKDEIMHSLTSVPIHPYEKLKYEYLEKDFVPVDIDDIVIGPDYNQDTINQSLTAIGQRMDEHAKCQIQALSCCIENQEEVLDPNIGNVFTVLSGDKFVIDKQRTKSHLEFLEFLRNIPAQKIDADPDNVCRKILSYYVKCYS